MTTIACSRCGRTFPHEIPDALRGPFRAIYERLEPVCAPCGEELDAERRQREREAFERDRQERRERALEARRLASGIPPALRGLTFEDVSDTKPEGALEGAMSFAAGCSIGAGCSRGLLLSGPVGRGKTWLAAVAAWERLALAQVRWVDTPVLLAHLGLSFADERREEALEVLTGSEALVLDDLDKCRPSEYAAEQLFLAIDGRVKHDAQLLITTNLSLRELAAKFPEPFGDAIVSRLVGHCEAFRLEGRDRRLDRLAS